MKEINVIGEMDNSDGSFESANRVYDRRYVAPTVPTACGGGHIPKVVRILGHTGTGKQRGRVINPKSYITSLSATDWKDPPKTIKSVRAINPMPDGSCRTLKYQYQKNSIDNFESSGSFGATGVLRRKV